MAHKLAASAGSIDASASDEASGADSLHVWLLIGTGVVAAAQIGKAIISVPMIRSDFTLGLDLAGLLVATFATLGATVGIGAGVVVGRLGVRRSLIGGMVVIALGNIIGAGAPDEVVLLAARIIEGVGFLSVVLAIPSMLAQLVRRDARDFVMAAWSTYMPTGIMLMLFAAPLLPTIGWRNFWIANALAAGACAALLAIYAPPTPAAERGPVGQFLAEVKTVVRDPGCLALAFAFFAYSCQIFSLTFALPLLLTSVHGMSLGSAGLLSALVLAVSAVGHLASGFLLRAGVPIWTAIATAFGFFVLSGFAVYGGVLPPEGVTITAALALGIGGLAPGAIYAAAPQAAPAPAAVPPTIGLVQQASNLGQFAGPVVLGLWVEHLGWQAAPAILAPAALAGLASALVLRRILNTSDRPSTHGSQEMGAPSPDLCNLWLARAFNAQDVEAAAAMYHPEASIVQVDKVHGRSTIARGADGIRRTMAAYIGLKPHMDVVTHHTTVAGDFAMTRSQWLIKGVDKDGQPTEVHHHGMEVHRRLPDGTWVFFLDHPFGADPNWAVQAPPYTE